MFKKREVAHKRNWCYKNGGLRSEYLIFEHLETVFPATFVEYFSTQLNSTQSLAEVVILSVCNFVSLDAIKYPQPRPAFWVT